MSSDIFAGVFSFFAPTTAVGAGETPHPRESRYLPYCHDTTADLFITRPYTHYNYCHLVVCCMRRAVGTNPLVTLTRGGA
ncbi:hypothetical protein HRTV-28_gp60 [Halorubrum tailed virus 28]|uniref:Uncharacterized protein n=1 Tax=Halorubrum tailed virus 28 TaxID=2878009 RepID=A0AAE9BYT3_9CAUD|nr:hypothetical protein M1M39_gp61 [Halorubrum tailed virus 28]UBF23498.1 hypothetical protein HRTV-28_gp60 [Halorubrum tailed virus 28]